LRIEQARQLASERFNLIVRQNADSAQVPMLVKKLDLFFAECIPSGGAMGRCQEKRINRMMMN